jgi:hypothetical protein
VKDGGDELSCSTVSDDRETLRVTPDGRVVIGPELTRKLAARPGVYRLLPTTGGLLLLQRLPGEGKPAGPPGSPGRALLSGEIDRLGGLADIIHFIHTNTWSGQLEIVSGQVRKALYCRRGDVQSAASNVPDDRLGAILYRYGLVSEEALASAVKRVAGTPNRIGQVLVEDGIITAHDLYTSMRRQVEEIFYSVLAVREGEFYFYKSGEDEGPPSQLLLPTKALLFEGIRRIDELSYFREKLPSSDVVLVRREPAPTEKLKPTEERVLQLVDGLSSIEHVARASHLGEFEATRILYQLLQSGWLQPRPARASLGGGAGGADTQGKIIAVFNEVYAKIHGAVSAQHGKQAALRRGLESFFSSVAEFSPLFVGVVLGEDGTLPADQLLANLMMCPVEDKLDYLHRGLNELLFFELFTAGEAVDRREEIALHQRLSQILKDVPSGGASIVRPAAPSEASAARVAAPAGTPPAPPAPPAAPARGPEDDDIEELEPEIEVKRPA